MNVHPLFVHFPIAFLILYSVLECLRFKRFTSKPYWFYLKAVLVILGILTIFIALETGELAKDAISTAQNRDLISVHATWGIITMYTYLVLAISYLILWIEKDLSFVTKPKLKNFFRKLAVINMKIMRPWLVILLALFGMVAITITGALGGAIVYGPDIDFTVRIIYNLFFSA